MYLRDQPLPYSAAIELWGSDGDFRGWFNQLLADVPFPAYFWECPPVTTASAGRDFEFVVVDSPGLNRVEADPAAFSGEFARPSTKSMVVTLPNLGADAMLLVPRPMTEWPAYGHLAAFVRHAPQEQVQALWQTVGETLALQVGATPVWLSTAGLGVSWLHVRLNSQPKYYRYWPFKAA